MLFVIRAIFLLSALLMPSNVKALYYQAGAKIVGAFDVGARQGLGSALSGDGLTLLVGAAFDNSQHGSCIVFVRNGSSSWVPQQKLQPSGFIGGQFGSGVDLSHDGNTALIGSHFEDSGVGCAYIFSRFGSVWSQIQRIQGTGAVGPAEQGFSVALSGDGNVAVLNGYQDASKVGAVWVFKKSGPSFVQVGQKLVASDLIGAAQFGANIAIDYNGSTLAVGANLDDTSKGALWIFKYNGTNFVQQGTKRIGEGAVGSARQGTNVAISADGTKILSSGVEDNGGRGAVWEFKQVGNLWLQEGEKFVPNDLDISGHPSFGEKVRMNAKGDRAVVSAPGETSTIGSIRVFNKIGDLWVQDGPKLVPNDFVGSTLYLGDYLSMSSDGSTILASGYADSNNNGACWVFLATTPQPTHSPTTSPTASPSMSSPSATPTRSPTTPSPVTSGADVVPTSALVGGVVGSFLASGGLCALLFLLMTKRSQKRRGLVKDDIVTYDPRADIPPPKPNNPAKRNKFDVFISHPHDEFEISQAVYDYFTKKYRYRVFLDKNQRALDLSGIRDQILMSKVMLVVLREDSFKRPWPLFEMFTAAKNGIPIITVVRTDKPYDHEMQKTWLETLDKSLSAEILDKIRIEKIDPVEMAYVLSQVVFNRVSQKFNPTDPNPVQEARLREIAKSVREAISEQSPPRFPLTKSNS